MQATFFASAEMRFKASCGIFALKHQHSVLPWLMPQVFGSPHTGQRLGSSALAMKTKLTLAPNVARFERAQSNGSES